MLARKDFDLGEREKRRPLVEAVSTAPALRDVRVQSSRGFLHLSAVRVQESLCFGAVDAPGQDRDRVGHLRDRGEPPARLVRTAPPKERQRREGGGVRAIGVGASRLIGGGHRERRALRLLEAALRYERFGEQRPAVQVEVGLHSLLNPERLFVALSRRRDVARELPRVSLLVESDAQPALVVRCA